jgi:hypothetical protein
MHALGYSPSLGRFLQPDPDASKGPQLSPRAPLAHRPESGTAGRHRDVDRQSAAAPGLGGSALDIAAAPTHRGTAIDRRARMRGPLL